MVMIFDHNDEEDVCVQQGINENRYGKEWWKSFLKFALFLCREGGNPEQEIYKIIMGLNTWYSDNKSMLY